MHIKRYQKVAFKGFSSTAYARKRRTAKQYKRIQPAKATYVLHVRAERTQTHTGPGFLPPGSQRAERQSRPPTAEGCQGHPAAHLWLVRLHEVVYVITWCTATCHVDPTVSANLRGRSTCRQRTAEPQKHLVVAYARERKPTLSHTYGECGEACEDSQSPRRVPDKHGVPRCALKGCVVWASVRPCTHTCRAATPALERALVSGVTACQRPSRGSNDST